jgi:hypothetical protein
MEIEYGQLTDPDGRPVGTDLFKGNTADAIAFKTAVDKARKDSGLEELVFVGDQPLARNTADWVSIPGFQLPLLPAGSGRIPSP